jgi:NitT/TauT family transport system permease protein
VKAARQPSGWKRHVRRLSGIVCLVVLWEGSARAGVIPSEFFPPLTRVLVTLGRMLLSTEIWGAEVLTLGRALGGFSIAAFLALVLAFATSSSRAFDRTISPTIELLRPLPPAALVPIAIFFFGVGSGLFVFVIAFGALWPMYISFANALRSVDRTLLDVGRSFGCDGWRAVVELKLPAALPEMCTGLRLGASVALICTVVVEMLAGRGGIGFMLFDSAFSLRVPEMFGLMIVAGVNGLVFGAAITAVRERLTGWQLTLVRSVVREG